MTNGSPSFFDRRFLRIIYNTVTMYNNGAMYNYTCM